MKLRIEKAVYGGAGLAHHEGKAIFVPFTLPGEVVEAHTVEDRGTYAKAELDEVLEASQERVTAPCPYFGECGGCHYQHANYAEQVRLKAGILRETLERAHLREIPEIGVMHGEPHGYRNRIRLHVDTASSRLCYKRRGSHANLGVDECPIAAPVLQEALGAVQAREKEWGLGQCFDEIEMFTNAEQSELLLTLWSRQGQGEADRSLKRIWVDVREAIPQIVGAAVLASAEGKQKGGVLAKVGAQALTYRVEAGEYQVSLGSFFQVNRLLVGDLVRLAVAGRSGAVAWDLYAGVGLFAQALSERFEQVVAVESAPSSVSDLRHNLGGAHKKVAATTLEFLRRAHAGRQACPDFVIVDPPRAGLGKEITALLADIRSRHITYVSCDPATLSRDLKSLLDSGYHLTNMHMVDLFPQTFHLESVAMLSL